MVHLLCCTLRYQRSGTKSRQDQFEASRKAEELPTTYIAMEALAAMSGARISGYSDEELRSTWPETWGGTPVAVPLSLLLAQAAPWIKYLGAGPGVTLGEAFKLEGGGQGLQRVKQSQQNADEQRAIANKQVALYLAQGAVGEPKSWEWVCGKVADEQSGGFETFHKARKAYGSEILSSLEQNKIIEDRG
jgi:hypothetical protein